MTRCSPATVTLWAAGVAASPLGRVLGAPVDRVGRVFVQPDLSIPGHPEVFVIGDLAAFRTEDGKMLPGVAPVAIQEGKAVAKNIERDLTGRQREAFHYVDKGSLATIGRAAAVAQFGKLHISGLFAWLAWLVVHISSSSGSATGLWCCFNGRGRTLRTSGGCG